MCQRNKRAEAENLKTLLDSWCLHQKHYAFSEVLSKCRIQSAAELVSAKQCLETLQAIVEQTVRVYQELKFPHIAEYHYYAFCMLSLQTANRIFKLGKKQFDKAIDAYKIITELPGVDCFKEFVPDIAILKAYANLPQVYIKQENWIKAREAANQGIQYFDALASLSEAAKPLYRKLRHRLLTAMFKDSGCKQGEKEAGFDAASAALERLGIVMDKDFDRFRPTSAASNREAVFADGGGGVAASEPKGAQHVNTGIPRQA